MTLAALTASRPWLVAGWTMLHFLWVGGLIGLATALVRRALRGARPEVRYGVSLLGLVSLALAPLVIASLLCADSRAIASRDTPADDLPTPSLVDSTVSPPASEASPPPPARPGALPGLADEPVAPPSGRSLPEQLLKAAAAGLPGLWLLGSPATFVLLATGLIGAERLRRQSRLVTTGEIPEQCRRLANALGLVRPVALGVCDRLVTPALIGVVRPLILLPTSALTGWSPEQVEMALLHELAHIRRRDNLVNLAQRTLEAVLFFHPAVWWVSAWVRLEREHCCDGVVIAHTGQARPYAELLAALAVPGATSPGRAAVAMAEAPIVVRIRRILNMEDHPMRLSRPFVTLAAGLLIAPAALVTSQAGPPDEEAAQKAPAPPVAPVDPRLDAIFRRAMHVTEVFQDKQGRAHGMTRIAAAQARAGDRDAARRTFAQAVAIAEVISLDDSRYHPHILLWVAKAQAKAGFRDEAVASFRKLLKIAETPVKRENQKGELFTSLVAAQSDLGDEEGVRETLRAGRQFSTTSKDSLVRNSSSQYLVRMQAQSRDLTGALRLIHDPELFQGSNADDQRRRALFSIVDQLRAGDQEVAGPILEEAARTLDANSNESPFHRAMSRNGNLKAIAEAEARLGRFAEASRTAGTIDVEAPKTLQRIVMNNPMQAQGAAFKEHWGRFIDSQKFNKAITFAVIGEEQVKAGDKAGARRSTEEVVRIVATIHAASFKGYPLSRASEILAKVGAIAEAIRIADPLKPNKQFEAYQAIAKAQQEAGDKAGEQATLEAALRLAQGHLDALEPEDPERFPTGNSKRSQLLEHIGRLQAMQGDLKKAIATIRSISNSDTETEALKNLAWDRASVQDLDGAMEVVGLIHSPKTEAEALEAVLGFLPRRQAADMR